MNSNILDANPVTIKRLDRVKLIDKYLVIEFKDRTKSEIVKFFSVENSHSYYIKKTKVSLYLNIHPKINKSDRYYKMNIKNMNNLANLLLSDEYALDTNLCKNFKNLKFI